MPAGRRHAIERAAGALGARYLGPPAATVRSPTDSKALAAPLLLRVPAGRVMAVVRRLRLDRTVAYAEPDYLMGGSATPNDPSFGLQWGTSNTGQAIPAQEFEEVLGPPVSGTPGADDGAARAWQLSTGSRSIVIGETDTRVDYTHPDLAANTWSNPGGIDGCAAGTHGYNVLKKSCDPWDEDKTYGGHGTHVAGIMGAVGNNGQPAVIGGLVVSPAAFPAARRGPTISHRLDGNGAWASYSDSAPALIRFVVLAPRSGVQSPEHRCATPARSRRKPAGRAPATWRSEASSTRTEQDAMAFDSAGASADSACAWPLSPRGGAHVCGHSGVGRAVLFGIVR